jgi:hypothetical protein
MDPSWNTKVVLATNENTNDHKTYLIDQDFVEMISNAAFWIIFGSESAQDRVIRGYNSE